MSDKLFLLGGYDLEMLEIKKLLESKNIAFKDKNLKWGAKLSSYEDELNFSGTIYGIELEAGIELPQNCLYKEIDHHGKNDHEPSSLEQVAKILDIELTRKQKLIAANDSRHISGMKALCATKEEIDEIRAEDRKAQGVTQEDEELAIQSINEATSNFIYSKTSHFSAVSDLVYDKFNNYIIYNDSKIVFYGYKKSNILDFLSTQNVIESSYYYGGGDFGFIGIKEDALTKDKIKNLIDEFAKMKKDELYSYHTFMLPFVFKGEFKEKENWVYEPFKIKDQRDYNEYIYFYKHVQDAIYNGEDENKNKNEKKWISKYYEYKEQKGTYTVNCKKGVFELELDGISLRIFNTKVAILSFNLKNTNYSELDDILAINDFGRRIYPQFLGKNSTCDTKNAFLANSISLQFDNQEAIVENFSSFDKNQTLDEISFLPEFITKLIDNNFDGPKKIRPIIDDRMFVISQYMSDELVSKLKFYKRHCNEYEYETNDDWYRYLFIDGDEKTCQNRHMTKKLIVESTYNRWVEWGTLFGVTRYSFVAVTGSWYGKNRLLPHMQTMYFQMFTLLLAYRATIIKFADDIQDATTNDKEVIRESKNVYKSYLTFLNKLFFKEVTAQDQGIELYNQAMKIMDIEKYIADLDHEINELHSYIGMLEEEQRNNQLHFISKIGAVLLPPSLIAGILGMNVLKIEESIDNQNLALALIVLSGLVGFLITFNWKFTFNIKKLAKLIPNILFKFLIPFIFILLVLSSFDLSNKFSFNFLKDTLLFSKKLEMKDSIESTNVNITNEPTVILKENRDTK